MIRKKYLIFWIFILNLNNSDGQTIKEFLVNDYKLNDTTISEIRETKTYFENSGISTYKRTYYYNKEGYESKMVGLDTEGNLSTRMNYEYDCNDNLIQIKDEKWNHSLGYSLIITKFTFDSINLKQIETISNDGQIVNKSIVDSENGYPLSIYSYSADSSLIGYEFAQYNYKKNEVLIKVYNSVWNLIGKPISLKLNLRNDKNFKVDGVSRNEFGDIYEELKPKCLFCNKLAIFSYEYKYDDNNNWVRKTTYKDNKKILIEKRKIKYRSTQPNTLCNLKAD